MLHDRKFYSQAIMLMKILRIFWKEILALALTLAAFAPTLVWMWDRWFARDSYYSHGILIPAVSIVLIWAKREELSATGRRESPWGLTLVIAGLALYLASSFLRIYFSSGFSFLIVLVGLVLHFFGAAVFRKIWFPLFFLFFMIPLPMVVIANISFQLKIFAAEFATHILNGMRLPAIREGSIIKMRSAYIIVDDVCSGLRSLISLTALGSIFAYWMNGPWWKRGLLFLTTIPIAVVTNVFRVVFLSAVSEIYGVEFADGFVHDVSGFMVFGLAFVLLFAASKLIE
jgi:exosortase